MELTQDSDSSMPYLKGESLCTATFQNKCKVLATVELVCFGPSKFPFRIDPVLNMVTRISAEKAAQKLPNPVFENWRSMSEVTHGKVRYGYCEIRGLDDIDLNVKKTAEFLLQQNWVGVVHMSDSSKLYVVPSSELSRRLGLPHSNHSHVLHGLFARKQEDFSTQPSTVLPSKFNSMNAKHSKVVIVNRTTDRDDKEPAQVQKFTTSSPRNVNGLAPEDSVSESPLHFVRLKNQSTPGPCKKKPKLRTESPSLDQESSRSLCKPQFGKLSSKNMKKTKTNSVITDSSLLSPKLSGYIVSMQNCDSTDFVDTSVCSSSSDVRPSASSGILNTSSVSSLETSWIGAGGAPSTPSPISSVNASLVGLEEPLNASSVDMSAISGTGGELLNTSSALKVVGDLPNATAACGASTSFVANPLAISLHEGPPDDQSVSMAVTSVVDKGGLSEKRKGKSRSAQSKKSCKDSEGLGKILTRKRGKESASAASIRNPEAEPRVKRKRLTEKEGTKEGGDDKFASIKVPKEVELKALHEVIADIEKLEAEAISITQEELPVATAAGTALSLLKKKPKKSCLSKARTGAVSQSQLPSTPTENVAQPVVSGEVTATLFTASQKPPFCVEGASTDTVVIKEVSEPAIAEELPAPLLAGADTVDNNALKAPKKVSLAEYKSRRHSVLDSTALSKDTLQASTSVSPKLPLVPAMDVASPRGGGSPGTQAPIFDAAYASTLGPSGLMLPAMPSPTLPLPSALATTVLHPVPISVQQGQLIDGTKQDVGLIVLQENCVPSYIAMSSLPSSLLAAETISRTWAIHNSAPCVVQATKSVDCTVAQSSQAAPNLCTEAVPTAKSASYKEPFSEVRKAVTDSSLGTVSTPKSAVSTPVHSKGTLLPAVNFTVNDVLVTHYSDRSTVTSLLCKNPERGNQKSTGYVLERSPSNLSATNPAAMATQHELDTLQVQPAIEGGFHRHSPAPSAPLPTPDPRAFSSPAQTAPSTPLSSLHSPAELMQSCPPAPLQSPVPLPQVYDSPSFHLICTSSPLMNASKIGSAADMSKSPELALELVLSPPSSDHPAESTVLAQSQTSSSVSFVPAVGVNDELTSQHQSVESQHQNIESQHQNIESQHQNIESQHQSIKSQHQSIESQHQSIKSQHQSIESQHQSIESQHQNIEGDSSVRQISPRQDPNTSRNLISTGIVDGGPPIANVPSGNTSPTSVQSCTTGVCHSPYSVCPPFPQTSAFYLPTCTYYPYSHHVMSCVPWTTAYDNMYQHYVTPTISSPSPSQPHAWIVAQQALAVQARSKSKAPNLQKGLADGDHPRDVHPVIASTEALVDSTVRHKTSHRATQTAPLSDAAAAAAAKYVALGKCDATVQVDLEVVDTGIQTDVEATPATAGATGAIHSVVSDVDTAVWKARQWLIHQIDYDATSERRDDIETAQGSIPSPVISGASNISDGDLMSNSASSDWTTSPLKEEDSHSNSLAYSFDSAPFCCQPDCSSPRLLPDSPHHHAPGSIHDPMPLTPRTASCSASSFCPAVSTHGSPQQLEEPAFTLSLDTSGVMDNSTSVQDFAQLGQFNAPTCISDGNGVIFDSGACPDTGAHPGNSRSLDELSHTPGTVLTSDPGCPSHSCCLSSQSNEVTRSLALSDVTQCVPHVLQHAIAPESPKSVPAQSADPCRPCVMEACSLPHSLSGRVEGTSSTMSSNVDIGSMSEQGQSAIGLGLHSTGTSMEELPSHDGASPPWPQFTREEHVSVQKDQPVGVHGDADHVRAVSLPPLSSRSSNSSGSPLSLSALEEESVFTFSKRSPGQSFSVTPSAPQKFGDSPPAPGKPKITMSAAEILAKVRSKRSVQQPLPVPQEHRCEPLSVPHLTSSQEPHMQEEASSNRKGHQGVDQEEMMKNIQSFVVKKQKKKRNKGDKSWCHISNVNFSRSLYGVYPALPVIPPLPSHPFLSFGYGVMPDAASHLSSASNSNKNNKEQLVSHSNTDTSCSRDTFALAVPVACPQEPSISACTHDTPLIPVRTSQHECPPRVACSQEDNTENIVTASSASQLLSLPPSVQTTYSVSKDVQVCINAEQQIGNGGARRQCPGDFGGLPCSAGQCVSSHLSATDQTAGEEGGDSGTDEKMSTENVTVGGVNFAHDMSTPLCISVTVDPATCNNPVQATSSSLCETSDDKLHIAMVTSPIVNSLSDIFDNAPCSIDTTAIGNVSTSLSSISCAPVLKDYYASSQNRIIDDKECISNEGMVHISTPCEDLKAAVEEADNAVTGHAESASPLIVTCSLPTITASIKQTDEHMNSTADIKQTDEHMNSTANIKQTDEHMDSTADIKRTGEHMNSTANIKQTDEHMDSTANIRQANEHTETLSAGNHNGATTSGSGIVASAQNTSNRVNNDRSLQAQVSPKSGPIQDSKPSPGDRVADNCRGRGDANYSRPEVLSTKQAGGKHQTLSSCHPDQSPNTKQKIEGASASLLPLHKRSTTDTRTAPSSSSSAESHPMLPLGNFSVPPGPRLAAGINALACPQLAHLTVPHVSPQLQDCSRPNHSWNDRPQGHHWQDHPAVTQQRMEDTSRPNLPLLSSPFYPVPLHTFPFYPDIPPHLPLPDHRLQRNCTENFAADHAFGNNFNPSGMYHSRMLPPANGRYYRSNSRKRL